MSCSKPAAFAFPPVQPFDIIIARSILETVNAFWVVFCSASFFLFLTSISSRTTIRSHLRNLGDDLSRFAIAFISAIIFKLFRGFVAIQIGLLILGYTTSGAIVPITFLPHSVRQWLWFNPFVHAVEWLRFAYYGETSAEMLSREYLSGYSTWLLFSGLALERLARPLLLRQT